MTNTFISVLLFPIAIALVCCGVVAPFLLFVYLGLRCNTFLEEHFKNKGHVIMYWICNILNWYVNTIIMITLYISVVQILRPIFQ